MSLISLVHRDTETGIIKSRAEPSRAEPSRAEPSRAEPSRAEPSRAEPSRAEPSRAEPSRAEPSRAEPSPSSTSAGACHASAERMPVRPAAWPPSDRFARRRPRRGAAGRLFRPSSTRNFRGTAAALRGPARARRRGPRLGRDAGGPPRRRPRLRADDERRRRDPVGGRRSTTADGHRPSALLPPVTTMSRVGMKAPFRREFVHLGRQYLQHRFLRHR